ncbi:MAG: nucleotidyltransferase family protein [Candidatus Methylomirabilis oxyfera]|nr:nucleotidyltransferase family protein [Candidatus Methylomirabilis oxyfera]
MVGRNRFCREDELLLLLARGTLTPEVQGKALACLQEELSWSLILKQALLHGVFPLLYRNLLALGFPGVPTEVRATLDRLYKTNAARNLLLARELARVLQAFSAAGIPVVPLKGIALAQSLYGDQALRICSDIDILVPRRMAPKAFNLLLTAGYAAEFTGGLFADRSLLRQDIETALARREGEFFYHVELHWGILWRPWLDAAAIEDLWAEVRPQTFAGVPAYALSPEWELLFLAVHAPGHSWQLKWIVDIHEVCSRGRVDWERLWTKAKRLGWEEVLRFSLGASVALFSTPIPDAYVPAELPSWVTLFPARPSASNARADAFFLLHFLGQRSDKLRYLLRVLLVPTRADRLFLRLPSTLRFLYYPLRPLRLGCKWGWRLVRAVSQPF